MLHNTLYLCIWELQFYRSHALTRGSFILLPILSEGTLFYCGFLVHYKNNVYIFLLAFCYVLFLIMFFFLKIIRFLVYIFLRYQCIYITICFVKSRYNVKSIKYFLKNKKEFLFCDCFFFIHIS